MLTMLTIPRNQSVCFKTLTGVFFPAVALKDKSQRQIAKVIVLRLQFKIMGKKQD